MAISNHAPAVIIIGGGISGLSAAWELQQTAGSNVHVTVLEASERWGGKVLTQQMPGLDGGEFIIDAGPESFVTRKTAAWQLTRELGLETAVIDPGGEASGTYVLDGGKPMKLPLNPAAFITSPLLSVRGKLRMLLEPFIPARRDGQDESLAEFVTRRLGREALEKFIGPVLGGIYNTNPEVQSILVTSPVMRELEEHGSLVKGSIARMRERRKQAAMVENPAPYRFIGFAPGAEALVKELVAQLKGDLRLNAPVMRVGRTDDGRGVVTLADGEQLTADAIILATTANISAALLADAAPEAAAKLAEIRHVNIGTVSLAYRNADVAHTAHMRGLMIPRREKRRIDAITWTSAKIPTRAPAGYTLLRVFFGGGDPQTATMPEAELLQVVQTELAALLNITAEPLDYRVARWPDSYPQAAVGHLQHVAEIEKVLERPFFVTGSSYRGLAVPDCIKQARETAVLVSNQWTVISGQ
ncbi:MAG: protoporphyrinogen oxidase [Ardenticatenaceae bacterium]|nr:protoporphyrinogen oxidase [Anaerolineales bacterium]MCB8922833.1 protoporphyrinogen oxidase [Ardenticatenaceae bacterium]